MLGVKHHTAQIERDRSIRTIMGFLPHPLYTDISAPVISPSPARCSPYPVCPLSPPTSLPSPQVKGMRQDEALRAGPQQELAPERVLSPPAKNT